MATDINPFEDDPIPGKKVNPAAKYKAMVTTKVPAKNFSAKYMSSPIYAKRLSNFNIADTPDIQNMLNASMSQVNGPGSIAYDKERTAQTDTNHARFPITPGKSNINIDMGQIGYINKKYGVNQMPDSQVAHELSHVSRNLKPEEESFIGSLNKKKDEAAVYKEFKKGGVVDSDLKPFTFSGYLNTLYQGTHDARPSEIKADLDALRYQMFKKGIYDTSKRDMTIEDYNKMSKDKEIQNSLEYKRLSQRFSPNDLIKINNTVAKNGSNDSKYSTEV